jgi:SAM-dependent methyltransferase
VVLKEAMFRQFSRPRGWLGRMVGMGMNMEHKELWHWALGHVAIPANSAILDVGCGGGKSVGVLARLAPGGKVHGIDYSEEMVQLSKLLNRGLIRAGRAEIRHASACRLPFSSHSFDLVACFECCYFWPDMIEVLTQINRVLKEQGLLLIANEVYRDDRFGERNATWARLANMQIYDPKEYRKFLTSAGYCVTKIDVRPEKNWISIVATPEH